MTARPVAPQPAKFRVLDDGSELSISWSWFSPAVFILVPFAIAWNAFLVGWYSMTSGMPDDFGPTRLVFLLFPMLHVAVGVGLIYGVACMFVNSTRITVGQGQLSIQHGPIYFPGSKTLEIAAIDQIYVTAETTTSSDDNSTHTVLSLKARTRDSRVVDLMKHIDSSEEALFLEQALERHLHIADQRVAGEYRPT